MLLSVCMGGFGGQQQRREQFQRASDPQQTLWIFCNAATCTRACQDDLQVFICNCKIFLFTLVSFSNEDSPWMKLQTWQTCFIHIVQCTLLHIERRFDEIVQVLMNGPILLCIHPSQKYLELPEETVIVRGLPLRCLCSSLSFGMSAQVHLGQSVGGDDDDEAPKKQTKNGKS